MTYARDREYVPAPALFPTTNGRVLSRTLNRLGNDFGSLFYPNSVDSLLLTGDSAKALARLPDGIFQACVTSPPYWSLRDYDIEGQIGLEPSLPKYVDRLVSVFDQVRR